MKINLLSLLALVILFTTSCKEDDETDITAPAANTTVAVNLHYDFNFGSDDFTLNTEYSLDNGSKVRYSLATYYLSKPVIMDDVGGISTLTPEYLLIRPDVMMSDLGFIEEGHAHLFNISLGIDSAANTDNGTTGVQPTDFLNPDNPLSPQPENMYWTWASGYIFVKIEGEVDYEGDGTYDQVFKYHLGTNEFRKDRSTKIHSDVLGGDTINMVMAIDYKEFLNGVDLNTEFLSMSMGDARPLGMKMMNQFDQAVTISKMGDGKKSN
jgi:hypothetical protein